MSIDCAAEKVRSLPPPGRIRLLAGPRQVAKTTILLEFVRRFPAYRPLLLCDPEKTAAAARIGIDAMPRAEFLRGGPPAPG